MNKILLLTVFLLAPVFAGAQGLEFKYQGQALEDGATVIIAAEEDVFGEMSCETNPSDAPQNGLLLKCPPLLGSTVTAELQILSNTLNASTIQWCMGGECTLVGSKTQLEKAFSPGPTVQVLLDATNIIGEGTLSAKLTVTLNEQTKTVYIQFVSGDATSIRTIQPLIRNSDACYDMSGRRIVKPAKGINIVNGKKVLKN